MRRSFIDNLRWICVLILFPYHTFMVYNNFGENFYVHGENVAATSNFIIALSPWLMPLMFLLAGVSSAYALEKRTTKEYGKERVTRLLIPLLFGLLLLVPIQTYIAEIYHNGYTGGYLGQYILFFTKPSDLSGYTGGFTPAHLWFIFYLFIISIVSLPVMHAYKNSVKKLPVAKISLPILILLFIIPVFTQIILDISGKSVGEYLTYFLFGFFLISRDEIQEKVQKHRFLLLCFALPCGFVYVIFRSAIESYNYIIYEFLYSFYAWTSILAILGIGKQYLNFTNPTTAYLSRASFSTYLIHQQWVVVSAFFALMWIPNTPLQMVSIILASVILTFVSYEIFKRFSVTRFMFGMNK